MDRETSRRPSPAQDDGSRIEGPSSPLTVVKVGGSLIARQADLERVASALVERRRDGALLLVVGSALKGVTDLLQLAAIQALDGRRGAERLAAALDDLRHRHVGIARGLSAGGSALAGVRRVLAEIEELVGSIRAAGELPEPTYARLLSTGERLSVILLAAAVRAAGEDARPIASEEAGLRAEGSPHAGSCDLRASAAGLRRMRRELDERILVLTGFYGVGAQGGIVLFGRGGSDNTACAVAAGLDAHRLELWKDVPGCMSADPQDVHGAHLIRQISFDEVDQLGAYGSSVLNHGCLAPLRGRSTRVSISSVQGAVSGSGTLLVDSLRRGGVEVVALAGRRGYSELQLDRGSGARLRELAGRVLSTLLEAEIPVELFDSSRSSLHFIVGQLDVDRVELFLRELTNGHELGIRHTPALVGVVGDGVAGDPAIRRRMLSCLSASGIRSDLPARPSGRSGLSCTVHQDDLVPALSSLHDAFFTRRSPSLES